MMVSSLFIACGKKSEIRNAIEAETTAEAYGDGEHIIRPLVMPLADRENMRFDSPLSKLDFVAGGFAKMFMDLGAGMGMGKMQLTMIQQIPEIPTEYIKGAKLKRLFFYIEPPEGEKRWKSYWRRLVTGATDVSFKFLDKLAVKVSTHKIHNPISWIPLFEYKSLNGRDYSPLQRVFEEDSDINQVVSQENYREAVIVKYDKDEKEKFLKNKNYGSIFIMNSKEPGRAKRFLMDHPKMKDFFTQINLLEDSLIIELKKDPVVEEGFRVIMAEEVARMAQEAQEEETTGKKKDNVDIMMIEECTENTCLDLAVSDLDLLPMIVKNNGLKIDAFIDARKVPASFKLKGFIEFEVKLKLTF